MDLAVLRVCCVFSYHFEVRKVSNAETDCEKLAYTHVLSKGKAEIKHYGELSNTFDLGKCVYVCVCVFNSHQDECVHICARTRDL